MSENHDNPFAQISMSEARDLIASMHCSEDQKQAIRYQLAAGNTAALDIVLTVRRIRQASGETTE